MITSNDNDSKLYASIHGRGITVSLKDGHRYPKERKTEKEKKQYTGPSYPFPLVEYRPDYRAVASES